MKILLINTFDVSGGPGRWTYMMHENFLSTGIESLYLVDTKTINNPTIIGHSGKFNKLLSRAKQVVEYLPLLKYPKWNRVIFSTGLAPFNVNKIINDLKPDIIHLNWINRGLVNIKSLSKLNIPIVWTMHDMWAFTGGCHYDENCGRYKNGCGECPFLGSNKENDLSRKIFNHKKKYWENINLTMVAPSRWLQNCAQESSLFVNKKIEHIPVGMDISIFTPTDKIEARKSLSLPLDKKLVLFGAVNAVKDKRKGLKYLLKAIDLLDSKNKEIELVIFGSSGFESENKFKFKSHFLGNIKDKKHLAKIYSAADVFVAPSMQDNMPATVMESFACCTPVVAFNIGGMPDMIDHKINGYLAKPFEPTDLAEGIKWMIENPNYNDIAKDARRKMEDEYDIKEIAKKYIDLYIEILKNSKK